MSRSIGIIALGIVAVASWQSGPPEGPIGMTGVWATDGYGMVIEIVGDTAMTIDEVTTVAMVR